MPMQLPADLEALVQLQLSRGAYESAEEVVRSALEAQRAEDSWTPAEREALNAKIDRALELVAAGNVFGPAEARRKLAAMREARLAKQNP